MSITLPNLDDRRYADLVEEARSLLVSHAPSLTNHNPSDPVVTIAEVFAYFTEILLYRVNLVTNANRVKFLRLLNGPDWPAPISLAELEAGKRPADRALLRAELEEEEHRTVRALRRTDRAVTAEDFELLAREADPARVARAHCIPDRNLETIDPIERRAPQPGHVSVVIAPHASTDVAGLLEKVDAYLEPRRLLTTRVHVVLARLVPVRVQLTLRLMPDALEPQLRVAVIDALKSFFDPITGRGGGGWPFGRNVYVSEIYRLLDALPGIDFVRRTTELDELATAPEFADRLIHSENGLISIAVGEDELVRFQPLVGDLVFELSPTILA